MTHKILLMLGIIIMAATANYLIIKWVGTLIVQTDYLYKRQYLGFPLLVFVAAGLTLIAGSTVVHIFNKYITL